MKLLHKLWHDEHGAINSIELILIGSVVLLGLIVGLAAYRDSLVNELADTARGIEALNQSYSYETDLGAGFGNANTFEFGDLDGNDATDDPRVEVEVSVGDSSFTDLPDAGEPVTITYTADPNADEGTPVP